MEDFQAPGVEGSPAPASGPPPAPETRPPEAGATGSCVPVPLGLPGLPAPPAGSRRPLGSLFEVALVVLLALFIALLLKVYVAEAYEIKGRSMQPTFEEDQRVMVLKVFYEIHRGDIIIFSSPENSQKDLIKRVVGLPGDRVEVKDGEAYINGKKLDEPYLLPPRDGQRYREYRMEDVKPGTYYVLGDNRPDSQDSRALHPIDGSSIKGKVILRWWPLEKLRSF